MDARELAEWQLLEEFQPLPDPHHSAALVAFQVHRLAGGTAKFSDFLPWKPEPRPAMSAAAMRDALNSVLATHQHRGLNDGRS